MSVGRANGHTLYFLHISLNDLHNGADLHINVHDKNLTFPVLLDQDQKIRKQYHVMGLPTSYLIDDEGKIRGYASGARTWDSADSHSLLLSLKRNGSNDDLQVDRISMQDN